jgi:hypothetical protein
MFLRYIDGGHQQLLVQLSPTQGDLFFQGITFDIAFDF